MIINTNGAHTHKIKRGNHLKENCHTSSDMKVQDRAGNSHSCSFVQSGLECTLMTDPLTDGETGIEECLQFNKGIDGKKKVKLHR